MRPLITTIKATSIAALVLIMTPFVQADTWRGTAPFCNGKCQPGETVVATSKSGNGATCWTGQKVLCRNSAPICTPMQTQASCFGVVEVCDNGYYTIPDVWHSCAKYACGVCFGFGSW